MHRIMQVNRERIKVWAEVTSLYLEYMSVGDVIKHMEDIRDRYGADARIEKRSYDYEDGEYLAVMVEREETDKEYAKRIKTEEYLFAKAEENDKREFERLKKKFGH